MAVIEQTPRDVSTAAAGATVFPYGFKITNQDQIQVQVNGVDRQVGVHFTVSGVGSPTGGDITFLTPLIGGELVMRRRKMRFERQTDYQNLGDLRSPTLNNDQDDPVMMIQQLADDTNRSLKLPLSTTGNGEIGAMTPLGPLVVSADGNGVEVGSTTLTGDMLLRPNLADASAGKGAALVAFKAAQAGGATRPVSGKLADRINVRDFGAALDGVTDDTAALNNAIAAAALRRGASVRIDGVLAISSLVTISQNGVVIQGEGGIEYTPNGALATQTRIKCLTAGAGIRFQRTKGSALRDVYIDGNNVAATPLILDRAQYGTWQCVFVDNATDTGWTFTETSGQPDDANMFNTFINCGASAPVGMRFTGSPTNGSWHNTFINTAIGYTGEAGILLTNTDNMLFEQTFIYRDGGTGPGVWWREVSGVNPNSITFVHLQAGAGGVKIDSACPNPGAIYGYDMSNGQPFPTVPNNVRFSITADGLNAPGWMAQRHHVTRSIADWRGDHLDGWSVKDNFGYGLRWYNSADGSSLKMRLNPSTRFGELRYSFDGSADAQCFQFNASGIVFSAGKTVNFADTATTVGAAGGASALPSSPSGYVTIKVNGTNYKVPYYPT